MPSSAYEPPERLPPLIWGPLRLRADIKHGSIYVESARPYQRGEPRRRPHVSVHFGLDRLVVHYRTAASQAADVYFAETFDSLARTWADVSPHVQAAVFRALDIPSWKTANMKLRERHGWRYVPLGGHPQIQAQAIEHAAGWIPPCDDLDGRSPARLVNWDHVTDRLASDDGGSLMRTMQVPPTQAVESGILVKFNPPQAVYCFTHAKRTFLVPDWPDRVKAVVAAVFDVVREHPRASGIVQALKDLIPWAVSKLCTPNEAREWGHDSVEDWLKRWPELDPTPVRASTRDSRSRKRRAPAQARDGNESGEQLPDAAEMRPAPTLQPEAGQFAQTLWRPVRAPATVLDTRQQVTQQVTQQVRLGQPIARLLQVMSGGREFARDELMSALGLADSNHFVARYLRPAVDAGLVEATAHDKPTSNLPTYRLTPKGLDWLNRS